MTLVPFFGTRLVGYGSPVCPAGVLHGDQVDAILGKLNV